MFEDRIIIDPEIRHGKPVIKGTRVPVDVILGYLAGGMEIREITEKQGRCAGCDRIRYENHSQRRNRRLCLSCDSY